MKVVFTERAKKDWRHLDHNIQAQLQKKLTFYLQARVPLRFAERLKDPHLGDFRFRIGDYRIIFDVIDGTLVVLRAGHRKDIY